MCLKNTPCFFLNVFVTKENILFGFRFLIGIGEGLKRNPMRIKNEIGKKPGGEGGEKGKFLSESS